MKLLSNANYKEMLERVDKAEEMQVEHAQCIDWLRLLNQFIRTNVDRGFITTVESTPYFEENLHQMRQFLSKYYKEPIEKFEPSDYALRQVIENG